MLDKATILYLEAEGAGKIITIQFSSGFTADVVGRSFYVMCICLFELSAVTRLAGLREIFS